MDVDGIQTPSKRCRTASGSAPTRATIARMTRLQKTRADALTVHYRKPPARVPREISPARRPRWRPSSAQPAGDEDKNPSPGRSTAAAGAPWRTLAEVAARIVFELGPRKKRNPGGPGLRLVSHKTRTVWFRARAGWPVREAPVGALVRERVRAHAALPAAPGTRTWESIGPTNIGGRMTSIVADPVNPDRVWVGAAGGGVWFSGDAGKTWESQWHSQDVLNVGALAIDPQNPTLLYCGTGEANLSADSYPWVRVYQ